MSAVAILKQSLTFYGRLFNKVFWLSVASSIMPLLMLGLSGDVQQPSFATLLLVVAVSMFFSVYLMSFIHQFSTEQDDSLQAAFALTLKKFFPVTATAIVFGLAVMLVAMPAAVIGTALGAGIEDEKIRNLFIAVVMMIPLAWVMYRWFFAPYHTLVQGLNPVDAIKQSNKQVKGNKLVFRGFTLLSVVMVFYIFVLVLLKLMIAVNPMALAVAEFALNVITMPFFSIYIYRLYDVTKRSSEADGEEQ